MTDEYTIMMATLLGLIAGHPQAKSLMEGFSKRYTLQVFDDLTPDQIKELETILTSSNVKEPLFAFAFREGIPEVVKYLYLIENVAYDYDLYVKATGPIRTSEPCKTDSALSFEEALARSKRREVRKNQTIDFLDRIKRYSKMTRKGKSFYYQFIPKYLPQVETWF